MHTTPASLTTRPYNRQESATIAIAGLWHPMMMPPFLNPSLVTQSQSATVAAIGRKTKTTLAFPANCARTGGKQRVVWDSICMGVEGSEYHTMWDRASVHVEWLVLVRLGWWILVLPQQQHPESCWCIPWWSNKSASEVFHSDINELSVLQKQNGY